MLFLHARLAIALMMYMAIAAIWGIVLVVRHQPVSPAYRGILMIGEGVGVVEALIGLVLLVTGHRPGTVLHYLYGALIVLVLPMAYAIAQGRRPERHALIFTIAAAFLMGLAIRATGTGAP